MERRWSHKTPNSRPGPSEHGGEDATAVAGAHRERLADGSQTLDSATVERPE